MKRKFASIVCALYLACTFVYSVFAEEDSLLNQFLGSPLLALTVIAVIVLIAFLYRKIRR
ncbi:MAG: hypothetical protein QXL54_02710 [Candidatus Bathyarchaeia archaeon]